MQFRQNHERGAVLVTTIVIMGLVTILIAALLTIVNRQNYLTARSATWCSEIPIAEAGIEEALAHLNSKPMRLATNGWTVSGSNVVKSRYFTNSSTVADGYFYTAISTARPPVIVSIGYGRIPTRTNYTSRRVSVMTQENAPIYGIIAQGTISGGTYDSYNSTNSLYSTGGQYDPAKRLDNANVGTLSSATPAISGVKIYGSASTGPGGTVDAGTSTIGDGVWNSTTTGIQPGHVRDDFNQTLLPVNLPNTTWNMFPGSKVLGNKDYKYTGNMTAGFKVTGNARLWITGTVKLTGSDVISISPGGSIEIYLAGDASFGGNGIVNNATDPLACKIFALSTCTSIDFKGNSALTGVIYAPTADVKMSGTPDIYGSLIAKTIQLSGNSKMHYDESLGARNDPQFTIIAWEEL